MYSTQWRLSSSALVQKNGAIIHRSAVSTSILPVVKRTMLNCIGSAHEHDAADRSFLDGRTQWTPLSAAIDNRAVSSVVGAPNGRVGRTDAKMTVFTRVSYTCYVGQA